MDSETQTETIVIDSIETTVKARDTQRPRTGQSWELSWVLRSLTLPLLGFLLMMLLLDKFLHSLQPLEHLLKHGLHPACGLDGILPNVEHLWWGGLDGIHINVEHLWGGLDGLRPCICLSCLRLCWRRNWLRRGWKRWLRRRGCLLRRCLLRRCLLTNHQLNHGGSKWNIPASRRARPGPVVQGSCGSLAVLLAGWQQVRTGKLKKGRQLDGHSRLEVGERLRFLRTLVSQTGSYSIDSRLERERETPASPGSISSQARRSRSGGVSGF